jgi:endonuclease III
MLENRLEEIIERLTRIERNQEKMMTTQAEFDAALAALLSAEAARDAAVTQALNDLTAKVAAGETIDLSAELAQITTLQANAAALTQTATADDPGPTVVPTTPIAPATT